MIKYIIHIADIHIGSGPRSAEYRQVFAKLINSVRTAYAPANTIIVIAGDIFHHKIKYSGDDIADFNVLLNGLSSYHIIVIPGNHDANLNDRDKSDLLSPIINNPNIHYWKDSNYYTLDNCKFYHISVFDDSPTSQLETLASREENRSTILLYHGMVNGAKFGKHTVKDSRITATILNSFKLVLLGDIHQQQFITPTVAYPGSLIQQNVAESSEKGYLVWDLETLTGTFIQIPNDSGFIRLDIRGKTNDQVRDMITSTPKFDNMLKVSVITDNEDDTNLTGIREKFGRLDRVNRVVENKIVNPAEDLTETMGEILINLGATDEQLEEITTMHVKRIHGYECNKWTVTSLRWDNMFRYGPNNFIDFTKFKDMVSGVIAANRAGKSSIIDILVFGLFGEFLRGDKKSIIHHGAKNCYIRVDFEVNGRRYYVERHEDRLKHSKIMLCVEEIKDNVPTWVNSTERAVDETYRKIKKLIGSLDQFLATGLHYDSLSDITRRTKTERMKVLSELFGLIDNEAISAELKKQEREYNNKKNALIKPRIDDPQKDLDEAAQRLKGVVTLRADKKSEIEALTVRVDAIKIELSKMRSHDIVAAELSNTRGQLTKSENILNNTINQITTEVKYAEPASGDEKELQRLASTPAVCSIEETTAAINVLNASIPDEFKKYDYAAVVKHIAQYEKELKLTEDKTTNLRSRIVPTDVNPTDTLNHISTLDAKLSVLWPVRYDNALENNIRKQIDKLSTSAGQYSGMVFSDNCNNCKDNCKLLRGQLEDLTADIRKIEDEKNNTITKNSEISAQVTKLNAEKQQLLTSLQTHHQQTKLIDELSILDALALSTKTKISTYKKYLVDIERLGKCKRDLLTQQSVNDARDKLEKIKLYKQYLLCTERNKYHAQLIASRQKEASLNNELSIVEESYDKINLLDEVQSRLNRLISDLSQIDLQIGAINSQITMLNSELQILNKYNELYPPIKSKLDQLTLYISCLGNKGLKAGIVSKNLNRLTVRVNDILSSITDFTIKFESTESAIDIHIIERTSTDVTQQPFTIPLELASGFQKFIVSIAFRFALTSLIPSSPSFIIIDEGFGCMDASNLSRVGEFLSSVCSMYSFTFIISHLPDLQNAIENPIYILDRTIGSIPYSSVNNSIDITNQLTSAKEFAALEFKQKTDEMNRVLAPTIPKVEIAPLDVPIQVINEHNEPTIVNAVPVIVAPADSVQCECGVIVKKKSISMHKKTLKHAQGVPKK